LIEKQWEIQYFSNTHNDIENGITSQTQNRLHNDTTIAPKKNLPPTSQS